MSASQGAPTAEGQSADGIVDEKSVGKIPYCTGPSKAGRASGSEWSRQMVAVSRVSGVWAFARMGYMCLEHQGSERPVWRVLGTLSRLTPAYPPCTRSVRTVGWEGSSAMGSPIPLCAGHGPVACRCAARAYQNSKPSQG